MIDREKVVDALRNCINKPKCQDCPWEECSYEHETFTLPKGLVMDMYDLLKDPTFWKDKKAYKVPIQSLIDHIKTACDVDPWAKEMAEELLKEQAPVEPIVEGNDKIHVFRCRKCNRILQINCEMYFCPKCGQPVKWNLK